MMRQKNSLVFAEDARKAIIDKMPEDSALREHIEASNYILNLDAFFAEHPSYTGFPDMVDKECLAIHRIVDPLHPAKESRESRKVIAATDLEIGTLVRVLYPGELKKIEPAHNANEFVSKYELEFSYNGCKYAITNGPLPTPGDVLLCVNHYGGEAKHKNASFERIEAEKCCFFVLKINQCIKEGDEVLVDYGPNYFVGQDIHATDFETAIRSQMRKLKLPSNPVTGASLYFQQRGADSEGIAKVKKFLRDGFTRSINDECQKSGIFYTLEERGGIIRNACHIQISANFRELEIKFIRSHPTRENYGTLMMKIIKEVYRRYIFRIKLVASEHARPFWEKEDFVAEPSGPFHVYEMENRIDLSYVVLKTTDRKRSCVAVRSTEERGGNKRTKMAMARGNRAKVRQRGGNKRTKMAMARENRVKVRQRGGNKQTKMAMARGNRAKVRPLSSCAN
jgi:hypothetical protein